MPTRRGPFSSGSSGRRSGPFSGGFTKPRAAKSSVEPTTTEETQKISKQNENLLRRLQAGGTVGPSLAEQLKLEQKSQRGLMWVIDQISRPFYGVAGYLHGAVKGGPEGRLAEAGKQAWRGLTLQEKHTTGDILGELGWEPATTGGKVAKGAVGLLGDIVLDPASWVTGGTKAITEAALERGLRTTFKAAGRELPEATLRGVVKDLAVVVEPEAGRRVFGSQAARDVARETAERAGDATLRGPIEEALLRAKPARTARVGFNLFPTKKRISVGEFSLARPGEALTRGIEAAGAKAGETKIGQALLGAGRKTADVLGKAFVVDAGQPRRVANIGRRWRDRTRAGQRQVLEDTTDLAREWETVREATPTVTVGAPKAPITQGTMRGLHGAGKKVGLDHEGLRSVAKDLFGVDSLTKLDAEQGEALRRALGQLKSAEGRTTGEPWQLAASEFYRRSRVVGETAEEFEGRLRQLLPDDYVWVYHATDPKTAEKLAASGARSGGKPQNLAMLRHEAGIPAEFAPGRGIGRGLYVGGTPYDVEGYGRQVMALRVRLKDLVPTPEQLSLGVPDGIAALARNDAMVLGDVAAKDIFPLMDRGVVPKAGHEELVRAALSQGKTVPSHVLKDYSEFRPLLTQQLRQSLPATTAAAARTISSDYAIMRAVDSGDFSQLPASARPFAQEAKTTFDEMGKTELAVGALDDARANYFPHVMTGYKPEQMDQLQNAMAKWRTVEGEVAQGERAAAKTAFLAEEMAKGTAAPAARAKWQERLSKLPKQTRFARQRTLETFDDLERFVEWARADVPGFEKLDIEKDWVKVMAIRKIAHSRVMADHDMLLGLRNLGEDLVADAKTAPAHFVDSPIPQLDKVKVHPQLARWLKDFKEPFTNNSILIEIFRILDVPTNFWKGTATAPRPGFHIRNALSNVFNNWLAGVRDAHWYTDALQLQRAAAKGPEALRALTIGGKNGEELWREAISSGVVGQGWLGADVRQSIEEAILAGRGERQGLRQAATHPIVTGRKVGTAVEDNARVAHYLAKRAEGYTAEAATLSVKQFLFDYQELTPFEQNIMKRFLPFFTWSRKNIPLQFSMLLQQPGVYTKLGHFKAAVESLSTGPGEEDLPDWMRKTYSIRLPWQTARGRLYANIDLPLTDLVLPGAREIMAMLAPLPRIIGELTTKQQLYSGRPIEDYPGEYVEAPGYIWAFEKAARVLPGWEELRPHLGLREVKNPDTGETELRMPAKVKYLADQLVFLRDVGRGIGVLGGQAPVEQLGSPFLGVGLSSLSPEKNALNIEYERNRILRAIMGREKSKGVEIPAAEKKAPARATMEFSFRRGGGKSKRRGPFSGG